MITLCARVGWPDSLTGKLGAAVIKIAQPSRIYHTGLLLSDGWLYQARLSEGVHRIKTNVFDGSWDTLELGKWADEDHAYKYWQARVGNGYDLPGLVDWGLRRYALTLLDIRIQPGLQSPRNEFCSELTMGMLDYPDPVQYSPSATKRECVKRNRMELV